MIEKYKTEGREISKKEMESIQTMESEMAVEKKKCMTYKMELAMLLPRKNKRTKKIKKLTWSEKTKKNEFTTLKINSEKVIVDIEDRLKLVVEIRNTRRKAALIALESKVGMKGTSKKKIVLLRFYRFSCSCYCSFSM